MRKLVIAALVAAWSVGAVTLGVAAGNDEPEGGRAAVGRQADGRVIVPTNQVLDPAGFQV